MPLTLRNLRDARLVLASASPRRATLLGQLGLTPLVDPSRNPEHVPPGITPEDLVTRLASDKAREVMVRHPGADLVLGADTVVVLDGQILGKPCDAADAGRMLTALAGRWHAVYTGIALFAVPSGQSVVAHVQSEVFMRPLAPEEISAYIATGEPLDKAGAYAIQGLGGVFVREIRGDYQNIVGLPLARLDAAWRELGWRLL
ncbi:MAG: Maf family protein [Candidatus Sericytochromatia bacterium]|nr:Maf family protein [Candidatus Sericytochromatia bacterium]